MNITVCIGSSCHLKGSKEVLDQLKRLAVEKGYLDKLEFHGAFCIGNCTNDGVSVKIDDTVFSFQPENTEDFFKNEIMKKIE